MKDMKYRDFIVHFTSDDKIRLAVAVTKDITETARTKHNLSPVACAALGRTMTGALLLAGDYKNKEGVTIALTVRGLWVLFTSMLLIPTEFAAMWILPLSTYR